MEHKEIFCGDQFPPISTKHPWLVSQKLEAEEDGTEDQIFYTINDPLSQYQCQIPELVGRYIDGGSHGWVILSADYPHGVMWSLWNPVTSEIIHLPPLILKNGNSDVLDDCCLTHVPGHPSSIIFFTRCDEQGIVFCRLADHKEKMLTWTETSYIEQLKSISDDDVDDDECFLQSSTCCDGKVYAFTDTYSFIEVDIAVNDTEVVINLLPIGELPSPPCAGCSSHIPFLKGYGTDLFFIYLVYDEATDKILAVNSYKLNMTSMMWEEMEDLKDAIFFLELGNDMTSIFYMPNIASELGGYIHILGEMGKVMYSYHVKDKTISTSSMPYVVPKRHLSLWECSLPGDPKQEVNKKDEIAVDDEYFSGSDEDTKNVKRSQIYFDSDSDNEKKDKVGVKD